MKHSSLVLLLFLIFCKASAQDYEVKYNCGGQVIGGISALSGDYVKDFSRHPKLAGGFGIFGERHVTEKQFFNVELNLCGMGDSTFQTWKSIQDSVAVVDSLHLGQRLVYFQVPVLFGYKYPSKKHEERYYYIKGGPYFGFLWSAVENRKFSQTSALSYYSTFDHGYKDDLYSPIDFGFQLALGINTGDNANLELRLSEGIADVTRSGGKQPFYNRMISFNLRYFLYSD